MAREKKITQKDIASHLGVSVSLVSRVLSGQGEKIGISQSKIEEVQNMARLKNYVPVSAAAALKGRKTRTIGVVVYDFHDPFFIEIISELQNASKAVDYSIMLVGFINRRPSDSDLAPLYKHFVDGIIIAGSYGDLDWLDKFKNIPIVRIGRGDDTRVSFSISVDEHDAARQIIRHLKSVGRTKYCYVGRDISIHQFRKEAAVATAEHEGCGIILSSDKNDISDFEAGYSAVENAVKFNWDVDSFICATDNAAMGAIKKLQELEKKIPEDYAVVGFNDIPAAGYFTPSITTIRQPFSVFATTAINFFSKEVDNGSMVRRGQLIVRESTMGLM